MEKNFYTLTVFFSRNESFHEQRRYKNRWTIFGQVTKSFRKFPTQFRDSVAFATQIYTSYFNMTELKSSLLKNRIRNSGSDLKLFQISRNFSSARIQLILIPKLKLQK